MLILVMEFAFHILIAQVLQLLPIFREIHWQTGKLFVLLLNFCMQLGSFVFFRNLMLSFPAYLLLNWNTSFEEQVRPPFELFFFFFLSQSIVIFNLGLLEIGYHQIVHSLCCRQVWVFMVSLEWIMQRKTWHVDR